MSIKFLVLGGYFGFFGGGGKWGGCILGFGGGGGSADFIFMGAGIFLIFYNFLDLSILYNSAAVRRHRRAIVVSQLLWHPPLSFSFCAACMPAGFKPRQAPALSGWDVCSSHTPSSLPDQAVQWEQAQQDD